LGFAADVIVWDDSLSLAEIQSLYQQGPPAACRDISKAAQFLQRSGTSSVASAPTAGSVLDALLIPRGREAEFRRESLLATPKSEEQTYGSFVGGNLISIEDSYPIPYSYTDSEHPIDSVLLRRLADEATAAYDSCEPAARRIDRYAEVVKHAGGDTKALSDALYLWAMLIGTGSEAPDSKCGVSGGMFTQKDAGNSVYGPNAYRQVRMLRALLVSMSFGNPKAIPVISSLLMSGSAAVTALIDLHKSSCQCSGNSLLPFEVAFACYMYELKSVCERRVSQSIENISDWADIYYRSAGCFDHPPLSNSTAHAQHLDPISQFVSGLLHIAAMLSAEGGSADAHMALMVRYQRGFGVPRDTETAAFYSLLAASASSVAYHAVGGMPLIEKDRVNDEMEKTVRMICSK
jgi:hypothetical protein